MTQTMPSSIVDAQVKRLLEVVNDYQNQQCELLLKQANDQARQIVRHTYHNARVRLQTSIQEDRQQLEQSLASVRARRHTFIMQQKHQAARQFLDDAWHLLTSRLIKRWKNAEQRQLWVSTVIDTAINSLPAADWLIEYEENWEKSEREQIQQYINEKSAKTINFKTTNGIEAGIRISADDAVVDGTLQGLLSDRVRIQSEILAQCTHCIVHGSASENMQQENTINNESKGKQE